MTSGFVKNKLRNAVKGVANLMEGLLNKVSHFLAFGRQFFAAIESTKVIPTYLIDFYT
jgi:hypothetical protein